MKSKANNLLLFLFLVFSVINAWGRANINERASALLDVHVDQLVTANISKNIVVYKNRLTQYGFVIYYIGNTNARLLAYSRNGSFNEASSVNNPSFMWWLNAVNDVLTQEGAIAQATTKPDTTLFPARVEPLITTKWGQREPFKFMCPFDHYVEDTSLYGTFAPDSSHYVVGCTAAAMAQYMNYYKYPNHGVGQDSVIVKYNVPGSSAKIEAIYKVDFEHSNYDWENMIDDYQGDYTAEQAQAVAQLCYHCGVAAQAVYNNLGTGSTDKQCLDAFINHFNYNDTAHFIVRSKYSEPEWMAMVYDMLSNDHPILYSGKDINLELGILAGHNFIIDGYDENGLVHVNWGWYGIEDGYYDIALLNPRQYTYDDWQAMYVGLLPKVEQVLGDVNGDGECTASDITALYNKILYNDSSNIVNGDVNGDGEITSSDATAVYNILLGFSQ